MTVVRAEGLEPPRPKGHQDLNLTRLPIPPRPPESNENRVYRERAGTLYHKSKVSIAESGGRWNTSDQPFIRFLSPDEAARFPREV